MGHVSGQGGTNFNEDELSSEADSDEEMREDATFENAGMDRDPEALPDPLDLEELKAAIRDSVAGAMSAFSSAPAEEVSTLSATEVEAAVRRALSEGPPPTPVAAPPPFPLFAIILLALAATLAAGHFIWAVFQKPPVAPAKTKGRPDAPDRTLLNALGRIEKLLQEPPTAARQMPEPAAATEPSSPQMDLAATFREEGRALLKAMEDSVTSVREAARHLGEAVEALRSPPPSEEIAPDEAASSDPSGSDFAWPRLLLPGAPLAEFRPALSAALDKGSPSALRLFAALLEWAALTESQEAPTSREVAATLNQIGQRLFRFWQADGLSFEGSQIEAIQTWSAAFRPDIDAKAPHLHISPVYPQDPFDHDRMEAIESHSGSRINVEQPLSWIVLQRTNDIDRILHRAQVITA